MTNEIIKTLVARENISVVEAMEKINKNARGVLFIVDDREQLIGSITDGDIRRWLIKTGELNETVNKYMNRAPKFLLENDREGARDYMEEYSINAVPILDTNKRILDVIFFHDAMKVKKKSNDALKNTPIIIMAGGKGTRLYPYTKILPKPLIPIGDVPIVERIINKFCEYGAMRYYLTVNYKKSMIKAYFSDRDPAYDICYIEEDKPLGTAGSIRLITDKITSPVIVTNCDTLIDANYENLLEYHITSNNALTIVSALKDIVVPYGVMHSKENGIITSMEEKPKISYFINTGFYVLNPVLIGKIPDNTMFHMTDLANLLIKEGYRVGMYPISDEAFLDMGEFEEMKRMEQKLHLD